MAKKNENSVGKVAVSEEAEVLHDTPTDKPIVAEGEQKDLVLEDSKQPEVTAEVEVPEIPAENGDEVTDIEEPNEDELPPSEGEVVTPEPAEVQAGEPSTQLEETIDGVDELSTPEAPSTEDKSTQGVARKRLTLLGAMLAFVVVLCGVYLVALNGKAQLGVRLAGVSVTGKSQAQLEKIAEQQAGKIRVTFKAKEKSETTLPSTAGIAFDASASAKRAVQAKQSLVSRFKFWERTDVPLVYSVNQTALTGYLEKKVIVGWALPKDASLSFNPSTKVYDVNDPVPGEGVGMSQITAALDRAATVPQTVVADIRPVPTSPKITRAVAEKAQERANNLLKSDVKMLQNGLRVFYLEPQEIDTLLDIIPNSSKGTLDVSANADRVQKFVDNDITNTIARASRERVVIVNPESGQITVLQEGTPGQKLAGSKQLASDIVSALQTGKPYAKEISVEESGTINEKKFTGVNRWAEVNLSQQMAYMHLDDQTIMSFRISSGRAVTPTDPGEWNVYGKLPLRTMKGVINGEAYEVPNVPWVVYFHDGEAFHGTYWHNNFGTPMSHGCINMTIADAKMMYNFAYIGMRVSVHY